MAAWAANAVGRAAARSVFRIVTITILDRCFVWSMFVCRRMVMFPRGGRVEWNGWRVGLDGDTLCRVGCASACVRGSIMHRSGLFHCRQSTGDNGHMALQRSIGTTPRLTLLLSLRWLIQVTAIGEKYFDEPVVSEVFIDKVSTNSQPLEA